MSRRIRIMTYNIHKGIGVDRKYDLERIAEVIAHHAPDIVCLQEVDSGAPRSREQDQHLVLAGWLGYPHVSLGANVALRKGTFGNATLSRLEIVESANIDLTWWIKKRRGALHTRLAVDRGRRRRTELDVFNLHLGLSRYERGVQVANLLGSPRFPNGQTTTIVAGDTNDWRHLLFPRHFEPAGFRCITPIGRRRRRPGLLDDDRPRRPMFLRLAFGSRHLTFPSWCPVGALDKIFVRGAARAISCHTSRLEIARISSDHLPVIAEVELPV